MSIFDGLGAVLADALGAEVTHRPAGGGEVVRRWHLRVYPEDVFPGEARPVHDQRAELRVPRGEAAAITVGQAGDVVETEDGTRFRIVARMTTPNPASDALIPFELEEILT